MNLRNQIDEKYKMSLKQGNKENVSILRLIRSAIKDKDIENRSSSNDDLINDNQILNVLQGLVKQRKDSIESFKQASRIDLVNKEKKEIEIINQFLPKQLDELEVKNIIHDFISNQSITTIKEMGKIMEHLKSNYLGKVDMGLAGKIAKELLGK